MFPSRLHLPAPLGSTVITRFIATTRALSPVLLLPAPGQVSLIHVLALPVIPPPTTPCAPALRPYFSFRAGLASDSSRPCGTISGSSDFAHYSQSRQSHKAVSSSYRSALKAPLFCGLSVHFQLLSTPYHHGAVTFSYPAGSSAGERLSLSVHAHSQAHEREALLRSELKRRDAENAELKARLEKLEQLLNDKLTGGAK